MSPPADQSLAEISKELGPAHHPVSLEEGLAVAGGSGSGIRESTKGKQRPSGNANDWEIVMKISLQNMGPLSLIMTQFQSLLLQTLKHRIIRIFIEFNRYLRPKIIR